MTDPINSSNDSHEIKNDDALKIKKRLKITEHICRWIARIYGIFFIWLFIWVFSPQIVLGIIDNDYSGGYFELLPTTIMMGIGVIGYAVSWIKQKGEKIGGRIMLGVGILMGMYLPILHWITEGFPGDWGVAVILFFLAGFPAILLLTASFLRARLLLYN